MAIDSNIELGNWGVVRNILIIDDDSDICNLFQIAFDNVGFNADVTSSLIDAKELVQKKFYKAILVDIFIDGKNGLKELRNLIQISPRSQFFSFTGHETIPLAVKAMELGAANFFPKSLGYKKIVDLVKSKIDLDEEGDPDLEFYKKGFSEVLIGNSPNMLRLFEKIERYSEVDSTVLITGESGTGKEVVGKVLHDLSPKCDGPFEAINCGAIPETLLESELFGHKRGAFTDAKFEKKGLFETCSKGTLMLDEIGDMPLLLQVKLLRVLQEREIRPLGSTHTIKINTRIIACTHRNLDQLVKDGKFRQDLFFRLSVLQLKIPPLRSRIGDIPTLSNIFVEKFNKRFSKNIQPPSQELIVRLCNYNWPGNIRELQNTLERAIVLSKDDRLHFDDLFSQNEHVQNIESSAITSLTHEKAKRDFESKYIKNLLTESKGNISKASRISGKHRVEIYRLMVKYGYQRNEFVEKSQPNGSDR